MMKALSLTQPWATLVVMGHKEIETRSWRTNFVGRIAIHAAKGFPKWARELVAQGVFREALQQHGYYTWDELPVGAVLGSVTLAGCYPTEQLRGRISATEETFGDYSDGRYGWGLEHPRVFTPPIPCRGALGLWNAPPDVERLIMEQTRHLAGTEDRRQLMKNLSHPFP